MRSFEDDQGDPWQAALLNGSYGTVSLVFTELRGQRILMGELHVSNFAEAEQQLAAMDTMALREALTTAEPWR